MRNRRLLGAAVALTVCLGWSLPAVADLAPEDAPKDRRERRRERRPRKPALKVGDKAPLFELQILDKEKKVDLKSFSGERPVLLFFGSYT
ncbi:MAG: hypothetical protein ACE5EQ_10035 [Phycisphaerae bacterium]